MSRLLAASLILGATLLSGAASAMHPDRDKRSRYCRQHPAECTDVTAERRAQLREWCENNPVDCDEERQALMELHREKLHRSKQAKRDVRDAVTAPARRNPPIPDDPPPRRQNGPPR